MSSISPVNTSPLLEPGRDQHIVSHHLASGEKCVAAGGSCRGGVPHVLGRQTPSAMGGRRRRATRPRIACPPQQDRSDESSSFVNVICGSEGGSEGGAALE